jgi:c-di-GMP-binding flagellar brake protein YcgR
MISKYDLDTKLESIHRPIERWLRKLFRWKSSKIPTDSSVDQRDFYRLQIDNEHSLDLCLTMQDERVFCTTIEDMSASGFSCNVHGLSQIQGGQAITALFALPLAEPIIIKTDVFLISMKKGNEEKGDFFRFRYCEEMRDEDRDLIHRFIVEKQFEALEHMNEKKAPKHGNNYPEALTGD